jgi:exodeoxyribonuclease V alpha subunit
MVGDPAQLPPIGAGNPFCDLIASKKIECVELTEIYRQSNDSVIALFANQIRESQVPTGFLKTDYSDWHFIDRTIENYWKLKKEIKDQVIVKKIRDENNNLILEEIKQLAHTIQPDVFKFFQKKDIEKYLTYFQVVTPIKMGALGVENINKELQKILNPGMLKNFTKVDLDKNIYCLFDKVIHTSNKFMLSCSPTEFKKIKEMHENYDEKMEKKKIFNGMIGMILKIIAEDEKVFVYYPNHGSVVLYSFEDVKNVLSLAYALTSHKTQGSQFEQVAIPMTYSHFMMNNVKLLYTSITRASKKITIIGERTAFETACKKNDVVQRDTIIKRLTTA